MTAVPTTVAVPSRTTLAEPPTRLRRVLCAIVLDPSKKFGSMEEQLFVQAQAFKERGSVFYPLFLCSPAPRATTVFDDAGLPAACLDLGRFHPVRAWQLARLVARERIEVVHWNFTEVALNPYVWLLSLLTPRVRHYYTDHNSRFLPLPGVAGPMRRFFKGILLRRYTRVICVSRFVQECLEKQRTWSSLACCHHFINTDRFAPDSAVRLRMRKQLGADDRFVLLSVAHLIKAKGIDVLLRTLAVLPPSTCLWVIGDGEEAEGLKKLAAELALGERVRFLGLQVHVEPYMQAADCFVCPSLWAEAAGLVNLEALSCGLPVLASRIGGIPEYVIDGVNGLLFPPGDVVALADSVRRLLEAPALCEEMRQQARAHAVLRFSWESRRADYLAPYLA